MKKLFSMILVLCMVLSFMPASVFAENLVEESGQGGTELNGPGPEPSFTTVPVPVTGLTVENTGSALISAAVAINLGDKSVGYKAFKSTDTVPTTDAGWKAVSWSTDVPKVGDTGITEAGEYKVYYAVVKYDNKDSKYTAEADKNGLKFGGSFVTCTIGDVPSFTAAPEAIENLTTESTDKTLVTAAAAKNLGTSHIGYKAFKSTDTVPNTKDGWEAVTWATAPPAGDTADTYKIYYAVVKSDGKAEVDAQGNLKYGAGFVTNTISNPPLVYTAPTAIEGLFYDATSQDLINAGTITKGNGTFKYSLDNETWSTDIPAGEGSREETVEYSVYWKIVDTEDKTLAGGEETDVVKVSVAKITITPPQNVVVNLTGGSVQLVTDGNKGSISSDVNVDNVFFKYHYGQGQDYVKFENTSGYTANNPGEYTVYWRVYKTVETEGGGSSQVRIDVEGWSSGSYTVTVQQITVPEIGPSVIEFDNKDHRPVTKNGEAKPAGTGEFVYTLENPVPSDYNDPKWKKKAGDIKVKDVGEYTVSWALVNDGAVVGDYSGSTKVSVVKYMDPEAAADLVYDGSAKDLVKTGTGTVNPAATGSYEYSLDGTNWSTTVPAGTDAKKYTVSYRFVPAGASGPADGHNGQFDVTVSPADISKLDGRIYSEEGDTDTDDHTVTLIYSGYEQFVDVEVYPQVMRILDAPSLVFELSGAESGPLEIDTDYEIDDDSVTSATNAGEYSVIINGIGNYTGTLELSWKILPLNIDDNPAFIFKMSYNPDLDSDEDSVTVPYTGSTVTPKVEVYFDMDYEEEYEEEEASMDQPTPWSAPIFELNESAAFELNGAGGLVLLEEGDEKDYVLSGETYGSAVKSYTLTITGKKNFTGSVDLSWSIISRPTPPSGRTNPNTGVNF